MNFSEDNFNKLAMVICILLIACAVVFHSVKACDVEEHTTNLIEGVDPELQGILMAKCEKYDIDFFLLAAMANQESSWNPNAKSKTNDYGLMQINKCNHAWLKKELGITDFMDPSQNAEAAAYMLNQLFNKYDDPHTVLMAYNMGEAGARKLWKKGIYSTKYSEAIMNKQMEYMKGCGIYD